MEMLAEGDEPPPYDLSSTHPVRWKMGILAEGDKYCSLRSQHQDPLRTSAAVWVIGGPQSK